MPSNPDVLFPSPNHPRNFSAFGYILGTFQPTPKEDLINLLPGQFITHDGREFKASIKKKDWSKLTKRADFTEDSRLYWRVYLRTTKQGSLTKIQLIRPLFNPPSSIDYSGETLTEPTDLFQVRGRLEKISKTSFIVQIERNEKPPLGQEKNPRWNPFIIIIQGTLPLDATAKQFGEFLCTREGEFLKLKKATLITDEMVLESKKNVSSVPDKSSSKSTESGIIMINGRQPEMTVKFNERPDVPTQGKKVTLQVTGENGIVVQAELNRKTLAKQSEKMDSFDDWVGALSGKVSQISPDGVVLLEAAGVQVFEKKQKAFTPESETQNTESVA